MLEPLNGTRENRRFGLEASFHRPKNPSGTVRKRVKTAVARKRKKKKKAHKACIIVQMFSDNKQSPQAGG